MKKADNFYLRTTEENESEDFEIDEDDEIWNGSQTVTFERMAAGDGSFQGFAYSDNYKTATIVSDFENAIKERENILRDLDPFKSHHKLVQWKNERNIELNKSAVVVRDVLYIVPPGNKHIFSCRGDYIAVENVMDSALSFGPLENPVSDVRGPCSTGIDLRNNVLKECLRLYEYNENIKKPNAASNSTQIAPFPVDSLIWDPNYDNIGYTYGFKFIGKSIMGLNSFVYTVKNMFSRFHLKKRKSYSFRNKNKSIDSSGISTSAKFQQQEYVIKTKSFKSIRKAKEIFSCCEYTLLGSHFAGSDILNRSLTNTVPENNSDSLSDLISMEPSPFFLKQENFIDVEELSNAFSDVEITESYFTPSTSQQHSQSSCSRTYTIKRHGNKFYQRPTTSKSKENSRNISSTCLEIFKPKNKPHTFSCPDISSVMAKTSPFSVSLSATLKPYSDESFAAVHGTALQECEIDRSIPELLSICNQDEVIPFPMAYDWSNCALEKISEGSYGDVYMITQDETTVIKIIPIAADNGSVYVPRTYKHVVAEIKVAQCMSNLKDNKINSTVNFCKLERLIIVKGHYPSVLLEAWQEYEEKYRTFKRQPDDVDFNGTFFFGFRWLSLILFFSLFSWMEDIVIAESVFKQVTVSLAIAEETHHFEHRDLHLGNILVQPTKTEFIRYILRGKVVIIPSHGVLVKIIDFTLSHITTSSGTIYYHDLAQDLDLFQQTGDVQYDVYRKMKAHLQNDWQKADLYSNVLWLSFLCGKLMEFNFKRPGSVRHEECMMRMKKYRVMLMKSKSALDFLVQSQILCQPCTSDYYASHGPIH